MTWRSLEGSRPRLDHKWIHHASPKGEDNSTSVAERFTLKNGEKSWDPFTAKSVPACLKINFPKKKAVQRNAERFWKVTKQPTQPKQDVFFFLTFKVWSNFRVLKCCHDSEIQNNSNYRRLHLNGASLQPVVHPRRFWSGKSGANLRAESYHHLGAVQLCWATLL